MAAPAAAKAAKKPALVLLDLEYVDGGSSPWFNSKGRSFVASLTTGPVTADLFRALAEDGSMSALSSYVDSESPSVSNVTTICYALVGLVLLFLLLLLPLALFGLRRFAATVGFLPWALCELLLLIFAGIQLICLLAMLSTWHGMDSGLDEKIPLAYEWTFQVLRNYTTLTVQMLKEAKGGADKELDNSLATTTAGIKWLRGNISQWDEKFSGYADLKSLLTGVATMLHMALLGFALTAVITSVLLACGTWRRRKASLAKGRKSPVFVAFSAVAATVLLCAHMGVTLPMIARWLPVCVLADTYLCAPYRDGSYSILDNSVSMVWPMSSRPDPFCRLVPSTLLKKCTAKGKTPIKKLDACPTKKDKGKLMIVRPDDAVIEFQVPQAPKKPAVVPAAGSADKNVIGDCFYPYKIIHTDMTSICPLLTDDLLAHWMAMVLSVLAGVATTLAATAVAVIFMAVGEPKKKSFRRPPPKKPVRSIRKRKHKRKKKKEPTPPSPVPSRSHASVQTEGTPPGPGRLNIVIEEPFPVPKKRKRRSQAAMLMPAPPPPFPIPVPVPVPIPVMQRSQDPQLSVSGTALTITPTSPSDVSPLSFIGYGSARGHHHCACNMRHGKCQGRAHGTLPCGYSPSALPHPGYPCVTTPSCQHSSPAYTVRHTPLCNRMRGVSPTAVEVMPARHLIGGAVQRPCRPPTGSSAQDKPQQL